MQRNPHRAVEPLKEGLIPSQSLEEGLKEMGVRGDKTGKEEPT